MSYATSIYSTGLDINTKPWYNEYDVNGSLLKTTAPNANTINYLYDNSGNLTQSVNGSQRNTFTYAFDGQLATQSKYVNDILVETATYNYDSLEHLSSKVIGSDTTSYTYNTMGSVTSVTSPTGFTTAYTLDKAERVTGVGFDGKEITYEYYGDGMVKKITYPNSMTTEYSYDNANRVTDIVTTLGSTVLQSYSYTYDGNGNVLTVSGSENVTYTYDSLNRLASSTKNGVKTTYGYDSRNNLVSETDGTNTKTYEYGGDNRLHKVTENGVETIYEYDLNGNLIQRGEDLFAYDENNRLVYSKVDGVETMYEIGVEGLRSSKTTNGVTTTYKLNETGYVLVENEDDIIYGNTALAKKSDTNYYYYLYNAHGDVTAIVDEAGNVVNTYEYDPWGEIISQEETVSNSLKYAGEYYDEETGLIYLRNRYYEPSARRFTTEDPARDDLNWYCYCSNNPIVFVDPSGLEYIAVSGSEVNNLIDRRYKYNFIEPAIKKLKEYKESGEDSVTWLISKTGYSSNDIANFKSTASEIGVNIVFFKNNDEFIGYLNHKSISTASGKRESDKIEKIAVFAHGKVGSIEFGYHQANASDLSFSSKEIFRISPQAFDNPNSCFYSCNTGTIKNNSSFAQQWVNKTGGKTWAIYEKSSYEFINNWDNWDTVIKPERKKTGYRPGGSDYYPIPSPERKSGWREFEKNLQFRAR